MFERCCCTSTVHYSAVEPPYHVFHPEHAFQTRLDTAAYRRPTSGLCSLHRGPRTSSIVSANTAQKGDQSAHPEIALPLNSTVIYGIIPGLFHTAIWLAHASSLAPRRATPNCAAHPKRLTDSGLESAVVDRCFIGTHAQRDSNMVCITDAAPLESHGLTAASGSVANNPRWYICIYRSGLRLRLAIFYFLSVVLSS
jgi:hypothetical protein